MRIKWAKTSRFLTTPRGKRAIAVIANFNYAREKNERKEKKKAPVQEGELSFEGLFEIPTRGFSWYICRSLDLWISMGDLQLGLVGGGKKKEKKERNILIHQASNVWTPRVCAQFVRALSHKFILGLKGRGCKQWIKGAVNLVRPGKRVIAPVRCKMGGVIIRIW